MPKKRLKLKLTDSQKAEIKKTFGNDVEELVLSEEDYPIQGSTGSSMRVLKIENIATVSISGVGSVVN